MSLASPTDVLAPNAPPGARSAMRISFADGYARRARPSSATARLNGAPTRRSPNFCGAPNGAPGGAIATHSPRGCLPDCGCAAQATIASPLAVSPEATVGDANPEVRAE